MHSTTEPQTQPNTKSMKILEGFWQYSRCPCLYCLPPMFLFCLIFRLSCFRFLSQVLAKYQGCLYLPNAKITKQGLPCLLDPTFLSFLFLTLVQRSPGNHNYTLFYVILCYFPISSHVTRLPIEATPVSWSESLPSFPRLQYLFLLLLIHTARKLYYKLLQSCYK